MGEVLKRAAGADVAKLKIAGLYLCALDEKPEDHHLTADGLVQGEILGGAVADDPLFLWVVGELNKWARPGDGHPSYLDTYRRWRQLDGGGT